MLFRPIVKKFKRKVGKKINGYKSGITTMTTTNVEAACRMAIMCKRL